MTSFQNIHLPGTSEFDAKSSPNNLPTSNQVESHQFIKSDSSRKCFYHNDKEIIFFCKHPRCTLPLCQKCLPIHRMEHLSRKQIPMENVLTLAQSKKFILEKLNQSRTKVTSNQKSFESQIFKYKQKIIQIIETTLQNLKQQLLIQDQQNSVLKLKQINQSIEKIQKQNSLGDLIKSYETYFKEIEIEKGSENVKEEEARKNSIINHIKFVPDEKNIVQTIERGFLHCKFVKARHSQLPAKINRNEYLKVQNQFSRHQGTPIQKLESLIENSRKKIGQPMEKRDGLDTLSEVPMESQKIVEIKRQLRKSIFEHKQHSPSVRKSLSFSNISASKGGLKTKQIERESQFSDVKNYKIDDSRQEVCLGKRKNIYTNDLQLGSQKSFEPSFIKRSSSNSSLRQLQKGLTLTRNKNGVSDHYLMKKRESIEKMKQRLLNVTQNDEASFDRSNSSDWKRVVTLSSSQASGRNASLERHNIYQLKAQPLKSRQLQFINQTSLAEDVLNPIEMRKLLMKKKNQKKDNVNSIEAIKKQYQQQLFSPRLYS